MKWFCIDIQPFSEFWYLQVVLKLCRIIFLPHPCLQVDEGQDVLYCRSAYAASKHALQAFSDSLRAEVARYNIKVSVISPGYITTALSLNAVTGSGEAHGGKYLP
jgi:NAD(P)-dependent dehydrogenase (short-subunit alcohol dehydrogenase family)